MQPMQTPLYWIIHNQVRIAKDLSKIRHHVWGCGTQPEAVLFHKQPRPLPVLFLASPSSETPSECQRTMGQSQWEGVWPEDQSRLTVIGCVWHGPVDWIPPVSRRCWRCELRWTFHCTSAVCGIEMNNMLSVIPHCCCFYALSSISLFIF